MSRPTSPQKTHGFALEHLSFRAISSSFLPPWRGPCLRQGQKMADYKLPEKKFWRAIVGFIIQIIYATIVTENQKNASYFFVIPFYCKTCLTKNACQGNIVSEKTKKRVFRIAPNFDLREISEEIYQKSVSGGCLGLIRSHRGRILR